MIGLVNSDSLKIPLADKSVHMIATSPPYWGLRNYGLGDNGLGLEPLHDCLGWARGENCGECYVCHIRLLAAECWRVLRDDGTFWLNLGSSYYSGGRRPNQSHLIPNVASYDIGDIELQDCLDFDYAYFGLCGEHLIDYHSHLHRTTHSDQPPEQYGPLLWQTIHDTAHLDSVLEPQSAWPLFVLASTTLLSWLPLRGECSRCDSSSSSLLRLRSTYGDAHLFGHRTASRSPHRSTFSDTRGYLEQPENRGDTSCSDGTLVARILGRAFDFSSWVYSTTSRHHRHLKPKDDAAIPWRVALALQADGWYLRSASPWLKKNSLPESVQDRPTTGHEYVFLFSKSKKYYYDGESVRGENAGKLPWGDKHNFKMNDEGAQGKHGKGMFSGGTREEYIAKYYTNGRNRRTTDFFFENLDAYIAHLQHFRDEGGTLLDLENGLPVALNVSTQSFSGAHFATWPEALVEPMIKAGTSEKGCCSECGSPWQRVIEKGFTAHDGRTEAAYSEKSTAGRLALLRQAARENGGEYVNTAKTIVWRPSCDHDAAPVPCIILDPCCGSGTSGVVARELGRNAILLDLSFNYLRDQARSRLEIDKLEQWRNGRLPGGSEELEALPLFGTTF